ncbi:Pilus assembly protein PilP [Microcystis aeruginosa]
MKKLPLILSVGSVALLLVGCPASNQANQSPPPTQETPIPSPSPLAAQPPAFSGAVQPATESTPPSASGFIPATDPDQKRAEINRGRRNKDPFASLDLQPNITITAEEKPPAGTPAATAAAPAARGNPPTPAAAPAARGNPPTPAAPIVKAPPPTPQPTEAEEVQVSGIFQLPTTPMAIVKAPGEATERRVIPGSTLSNGLILVKAINTDPDNPYIVLEQYGQTITRRLGDVVPEPAAAPQASISYNIPESGE